MMKFTLAFCYSTNCTTTLNTRILWFMLAATTCMAFCHCQSTIYWVRPNITVDCPENLLPENCVTLPDIVANNDRFFTSNTEIHFLAGEHRVTYYEDTWIGVSEKWEWYQPVQSYNISLTGEHRRTVINCQRTNIGFVFVRVSNLSISGLKIVGCGFNVTKYFESQSTNKYEQLSVYTSFFLQYTDFSLAYVTIMHSVGFGLLGSNLATRITIDQSIFQYNNRKFFLNGSKEEVHLPGGEVYLEISYRCEATISNSIFSHGLVTHAMPFYKRSKQQQLTTISKTQSAGITLDLLTMLGTITISNCTFYNNTALMGAHLLIQIPGGVKLSINECTLKDGRATENGGAVHIDYQSTDVNRQTTMSFSDCAFYSNRAKNLGGGLYFVAFLAYSEFDLHIEECIFQNNNAMVGAAMYNANNDIAVSPQRIMILKSLFSSNNALKYGGAIFSTYTKNWNSRFTFTYVIISESDFVNNTAERGSGLCLNSAKNIPDAKRPIVIKGCSFTRHNTYLTGDGSVVQLNAMEYTLITNTSIINNECRGIHANMSIIEVGTNVWITNNKARLGAGIFFDCYPPSLNRVMSRMIIDNSSLYISDNHAISYGGGIAFESGCNEPETCFFEARSVELAIFMSGNTAGIAGTSVYGGDLEHCYMGSQNYSLNPVIFWSIFNISGQNAGPSVVASQPYKVCFCNNNFEKVQNCTFDFFIEVYPGQIFHVPAVGVGQYNNSSPSVIRAKIPKMFDALLDDQQITQEANLTCKNASYSLRTLEKLVTIQLFIQTSFSSDLTLPELPLSILHVTILDCPLGFQLFNSTRTCNCFTHLTVKGVTCNILDQTVHRTRTQWIGNFSGDVVVHENCPSDHCRQIIQDFDLDSQDKQCNFKRTGILCGACQDGYSLALGTSNCKVCTNMYLLLLIPILLAGIGLVLLLLKCNLTVSTGTINGLVLYANIIHANKRVIFPPYSISITDAEAKLNYFLSIFIAWLNLDLGIEVCFAEKLGSISRTWLQFLFPIYIWLMVGILILVCKYSTTISRLTGSNTVSVLATLFLLSYSKLLLTTLNIFSPTTINDRYNKPHLRWLLDGNYGFLHWPHLALFLIGLVTILAHLLPFTLLVLLGPVLQANTNYRALNWVPRFKPFLDAFQGPYKTKHRYWTGLMLLLRVFLYAVFAGTATGDPDINLLTISLTSLLLLIIWVKVGRVYRESPINGLELFYLLNLGITVTATLYLRRTTGNLYFQQKYLSLIMVGSVFIVFIITLAYHSYSWFKKTTTGKTFKSKLLSKWEYFQNHRAINDDNIQQDESNQQQIRMQSPTRTVVTLEEPLL